MLERWFSTPLLPRALAGDLSLVLLFVGIAVAMGFIFGRWKLVNILINVYITVALIGILPSDWFVFSVYAKAFTFLGVLAFLTAVDERLFDIHITSAGTDFFWRFFVTSFLVSGTVVSTFFSFLPRSIALQWITPTLYGYVASQWALIFWLVVPLFSLFFINKRLR